MEWILIASLVLSIFCLLLTVFLWRFQEKKTVSILDGLALKLSSGLEGIYTDLEPVINASSRAMGAISSLSDDTKMDKALESRIGQDLLAQNEDILEVVQIAFPRVAEYIQERPEAVTKLMPRLNALLSDPEARKRLNLGDFKGGDLSRFWNDSR